MELPEDIFEVYRRGGRGNALDIGVGLGDNIRRIVSARRRRIVVGLDIGIEGMGRILEVGAEVVQATSEHMPFRDESFVLAASTYSFHHFNDRKAVVKEIKRILKPMGFALIVDWLPRGHGLAYHAEEELRRSMLESISALRDNFTRFHMEVREDIYAVFVEKEY